MLVYIIYIYRYTPSRVLVQVTEPLLVKILPRNSAEEKLPVHPQRRAAAASAARSLSRVLSITDTSRAKGARLKSL